MSNEQKIARTLVLIEDYILDQGFIVRQYDDFKKFEKHGKRVRKAAGVKGVSGQFQQRNFDYVKSNGFWIEYCFDGEPVSVMGLRIDRLEGETLAELWDNQQPRVYRKGGKIGKAHCPLAYEMTGNIVYGGEFTIPRKFRKNGLGGIMIFYGLMLAMARWRDTDWVYGLMNETLAMHGFAHRMGFLNNLPRGTDWAVEPKGISTRDWLCATQGKDMMRWADLISDYGLGVILPHKI